MCKVNFTSSNGLETHIVEHTSNGDWQCGECSYQTNSIDNLRKHTKTCKHIYDQTEDSEHEGEKSNFSCDLCEEYFPKSESMMKHRQTVHKTFKPCRNLPNCQFNDCVFNHNPIDDNTHICYECGEKFNIFSSLMFHRKNNHSMENCLKFSQNNCKFNDKSCWYNHGYLKNTTNENVQGMKSPEKMNNSRNQTTHGSVFHKTPANLVPPSSTPMGPPMGHQPGPPLGSKVAPQTGPQAGQPSQATWLRMVTMMKELNMMMMNMKNVNPFLTL